MKKWIILIILGGTALFSYYYSSDVYRYIVTTYYGKVKKQTIDELIEKAHKLYKEKKHEDLEGFLKTLNIVYPENLELQKLAAMNYMKLGKKEKGAEMILAIRDRAGIPDEMFEDTIEVLFSQEYYSEIMDIMTNRATDNPNVLHYYGVSLYKQHSYARSSTVLKWALDAGKTEFTTYYYLGLVQEKLNDNAGAVSNLERARILKRRDRDVNRALLLLYRKLGRYQDAEKIVREMR